LSQHTKAIELLENMDMKAVRYFLRMTIDLHDDLPEPVLPEGLTIKAWSEVADTITFRDIAQTDYDGFRDHYGFTEQPFEEMLEDWEHWLASDKTIDRDLWFLPMTEDGQLAGVCLCLTKSQNVDNWGYLDSLAVLPEWRRQGVALALLHHTFRAFRARGYEKVELHVDAESLTGATRVYERAGMYESERSIEYMKVLRPGRDITRK
ncbi:MAG: GNAT family N-acetyltransferase, partial [Anaerolineales bacterium]|nr:GNAT family N-acetyltransferase [Anaerolineales bacterium]